MHVQFCGHVLFDGVEEVAELQRTVPALGLADQRAALGIERGKQGGGAVARVVMRATLDLPRAHR